ncbi:hypothetical protein NE236_20260 [Actinoallomurus purpureus]|uniref:hypothetical protein n=1 Tax=Actinoallomurus purpureus TaxID=478114 RepID=UPI00209313B5|nr:hypothetical protein [Actinoallomurus purpureus]MCO6007318.1 hypothetical protein [Actinoallomurus purpureus]
MTRWLSRGDAGKDSTEGPDDPEETAKQIYQARRTLGDDEQTANLHAECWENRGN